MYVVALVVVTPSYKKCIIICTEARDKLFKKKLPRGVENRIRVGLFGKPTKKSERESFLVPTFLTRASIGDRVI